MNPAPSRGGMNFSSENSGSHQTEGENGFLHKGQALEEDGSIFRPGSS